MTTEGGDSVGNVGSGGGGEIVERANDRTVDGDVGWRVVGENGRGEESCGTGKMSWIGGGEVVFCEEGVDVVSLVEAEVSGSVVDLKVEEEAGGVSGCDR